MKHANFHQHISTTIHCRIALAAHIIRYADVFYYLLPSGLLILH